MTSALQNAVHCDNATNRLLTKWRHHKAWLVVFFPIYFAATLVRIAARAVLLQRSRLPLERLVPAVGRRFHRYVRVIGVPFDYIVYSYSLYGSLCAVRWVNRLPATERASIVARLEASSEHTQVVLISLLGASRKIGNPNNRLPVLCESVINTASHSGRIELVLRIDDDDDLLYYLAIKDRFSSK